jgi:aldehyde dehydrogenase (NAD+)
MRKLTSQLEAMRLYFNSGATRTRSFRERQLEVLRSIILKYEEELQKALFTDLRKSAEETWVTETGFVLSEINAIRKNLQDWMRPEKVPTNFVNFPSSSNIYREPLGVVLIISPWNYPFQLLFAPLAGAIAAGNCVFLKASEYATAVGLVMEKMINEAFSPEYISFDKGEGAEVIPHMMKSFRFDHVFYTGSTQVGGRIYQLAAEQLVPVTLELGGKSPCVIEADANLDVAARRIAVAKFSNAGQMCVAPDYLLVDDEVYQDFLDALIETIRLFFSENPATSYSFGRIINLNHYKRLSSLMTQGRIEFGGRTDEKDLYIEPTILTNVDINSPLMKEEIFGPILPVLPFRTREEAKTVIAQNPSPLAFYVFSESTKKAESWMNEIPFGGGCINNASWHLTNHHLPFGGRGNSGMGAYHGKSSFDVFSHRKSIMQTPTWFDPAIKYPPFKGKLGIFKKVIR